MASKKYAAVDRTRCVACGECEMVCPKCIVKVYRGCFAVIDSEVCIGCGKCAGLCPAGCISLKARSEA